MKIRLALSLALAFCAVALAQKPAETPNPRLAELDALTQKMDASLASMTARSADRSEGDNSEKIFAHYADASLENLAVLRNEASSENARAENRFYLAGGKVAVWSLYREDKSDSPRARKRLTRYYCDADGAVFYIAEKSALLSENIENQAFAPVQVADARAMTEFVSRKFQHLLEAFQKANSGN